MIWKADVLDRTPVSVLTPRIISLETEWTGSCLWQAGRLWQFPEVTGQAIRSSVDDCCTLHLHCWSSSKPYADDSLQLPTKEECRVRTVSTHTWTSQLLDLTGQLSKHLTTLLFPHQMTVFHFWAFKQNMLSGLHARFLNKPQKPSMCLANLQAQKKPVTMQTHTHLNDKILNTDASVSKLVHKLYQSSWSKVCTHLPVSIILQSWMWVWMLSNPPLSTSKFILLPNTTSTGISTSPIFTASLVHTKE